ncbi:MAG: hypothetical protein COA33_005915 [Fluviicola sp.]|nr:hypothetical protein [Fluviicola sp.]
MIQLNYNKILDNPTFSTEKKLIKICELMDEEYQYQQEIESIAFERGDYEMCVDIHGLTENFSMILKFIVKEIQLKKEHILFHFNDDFVAHLENTKLGLFQSTMYLSEKNGYNFSLWLREVGVEILELDIEINTELEWADSYKNGKYEIIKQKAISFFENLGLYNLQQIIKAIDSEKTVERFNLIQKKERLSSKQNFSSYFFFLSIDHIVKNYHLEINSSYINHDDLNGYANYMKVNVSRKIGEEHLVDLFQIYDRYCLEGNVFNALENTTLMLNKIIKYEYQYIINHPLGSIT